MVETPLHTVLTREEITAAAEGLGVEPAVLAAVTDVESSGEGFLPDGRPKILFEGHIFWRQLEKRGIDPAPYAAEFPTIVYREPTHDHYIGGEAEHERLAIARRIHEEAALCSASWGTFQLMGFNYERAGFSSIQEFVAAHEQSERDHLKAAVRWMKTRGLVGAMKRKDWAGFAYAYNGEGYKENRYDERLAEAYARRVAEGWNEPLQLSDNA